MPSRAPLRLVRDSYRPTRAYLRLVTADFSPMRAYFKLERANFRPERADLRPERTGFRLQRLEFRLKYSSMLNLVFYPREGWTYADSPWCSTGHWPYGAAAQKVCCSNTCAKIRRKTTDAMKSQKPYFQLAT